MLVYIAQWINEWKNRINAKGNSKTHVTPRNIGILSLVVYFLLLTNVYVQTTYLRIAQWMKELKYNKGGWNEWKLTMIKKKHLEKFSI